MHKSPSVMRSRVPLNHFNVSADSHAWNAAPVELDWTCLYTNVVWKITNILIFPDGALQLTLHDTTAVHFHYRGTPWTDFVPFFYILFFILTSNQWDKVRYLNLNRQLRTLYKGSRKFQKRAAQAKDSVTPVAGLPATGGPVKTLPHAFSTQ